VYDTLPQKAGACDADAARRIALCDACLDGIAENAAEATQSACGCFRTAKDDRLPHSFPVLTETRVFPAIISLRTRKLKLGGGMTIEERLAQAGRNDAADAHSGAMAPEIPRTEKSQHKTGDRK
jgi:hypothetical protein